MSEFMDRPLKGFEVMGTLILTAHEGEDGYINGLMFSDGHAFKELEREEKMALLAETRKLIDHMIGAISDSIKEQSN